MTNFKRGRAQSSIASEMAEKAKQARIEARQAAKEARQAGRAERLEAGEGVDAMGAVSLGSAAASTAGAAMQNSDNDNTSVAGGVLSGAGTGASMGASVGSIIPGVGTAIGAGAGALIGGIAGGIGADRANEAEEEAEEAKQAAIENQEFVNNAERSEPIQPSMYRFGTYAADMSKVAEVEKGEVIFKKDGKGGYRMKADMSDALSHKEGGTDVNIDKGDIVFPKEKRKTVLSLYKRNDNLGLERERMTLPKE